MRTEWCPLMCLLEYKLVKYVWNWRFATFWANYTFKVKKKFVAGSPPNCSNALLTDEPPFNTICRLCSTTTSSKYILNNNKASQIEKYVTLTFILLFLILFIPIIYQPVKLYSVLSFITCKTVSFESISTVRFHGTDTVLNGYTYVHMYLEKLNSWTVHHWHLVPGNNLNFKSLIKTTRRVSVWTNRIDLEKLWLWFTICEELEKVQTWLYRPQNKSSSPILVI